MSVSETEQANRTVGRGGYDLEYRSAQLLWSDQPASLVRSTFAGASLEGWRVLDLGCGEGKNAAFLARLGASVLAVDVSEAALENAHRRWHAENLDIEFVRADVDEMNLARERFDAVISYGLLHCLGGHAAAQRVAEAAKTATKPGGINVVCALNSRLDGFTEGHVGFRPVLLSHGDYVALYADWSIESVEDGTITETHPPNWVEHQHAVTRLRARKP